MANIERRSGKSLKVLAALVKKFGLGKFGEIRELFKSELGLGHGDANTLAHYALGSAPLRRPPAAGSDVLDEIYAGPKAALRPIHDKLMATIGKFGAFEVAPKKGYVSLRRSKQFAMIGPATNARVEVGLNARDLPSGGRLETMPPKSMCQYRVKLTEASQVDAELLGRLWTAYDAAG